MKERELIIILIVTFFVTLELFPDGIKSESLRTVENNNQYVEVVKNGEERVYPLSSISHPSKHGDRLEYLDDGTVIKTTMEGGKRILFGMVININRARINDLVALPGIGEKTATTIVDHRRKFGNFEKIEDLTKVRGIGEKKLNKIKMYIET